MDRTCVVCARVCPPKKNTGPKTSKGPFCSEKCRVWQHHNPGKTRPPQEERACATPGCGRWIGDRAGRTKHCSKECGELARGQRKSLCDVEGVCIQCGSPFAGKLGAQRCAGCAANKTKTSRVCVDCGRTYLARKGFRCRKCSAIRNASLVHCKWCHKLFPYVPRYGGTLFCGAQCSALYSNTGKASAIHWDQCEFCSEWFVARSGRRCMKQPCVSRRAALKLQARRDRDRDKYRNDPEHARLTCQRIMSLYAIAIRELDIPKASMWRQHLVAYLRSRDGDNCGICHKPVDLAVKSGPKGSDTGSSIDHVIPRSKGGSDDLTNLRLTHWGCNRNRGNRGGYEQLLLVG